MIFLKILHLFLFEGAEMKGSILEEKLTTVEPFFLVRSFKQRIVSTPQCPGGSAFVHRSGCLNFLWPFPPFLNCKTSILHPNVAFQGYFFSFVLPKPCFFFSSYFSWTAEATSCDWQPTKCNKETKSFKPWGKSTKIIGGALGFVVLSFQSQYPCRNSTQNPEIAHRIVQNCQVRL